MDGGIFYVDVVHVQFTCDIIFHVLVFGILAIILLTDTITV
jgi:hypothetical protein